MEIVAGYGNTSTQQEAGCWWWQAVRRSTGASTDRFQAERFSKDEAQGVVIAVRQLPGYPTAAGMIAQALSVRADRILLDFAAQGVAVRFRVDGAWENMPPLDRANGDGALFAIKKLFGMNPNDRRARQTGKCNLQFSGVDWIVEALSQGCALSAKGPCFRSSEKKPVLKSLADLGMRDKMAEELRGFLNGHGGMVIVSGPAGQGLPTTWKIVLESADKFVRDFISIEDAKELDPDIINVSKVTFDTSAGETPEGVLTRRILKQPDAFVMPVALQCQRGRDFVQASAWRESPLDSRVVATMRSMHYCRWLQPIVSRPKSW